MWRVKPSEDTEGAEEISKGLEHCGDLIPKPELSPRGEGSRVAPHRAALLRARSLRLRSGQALRSGSLRSGSLRSPPAKAEVLPKAAVLRMTLVWIETERIGTAASRAEPCLHRAQRGLKLTDTSSVVSAGAGAYFHFMTAFDAHSASTGLPPRTWTLETVPLASTVTLRRTNPPICACCRASGYSGFTVTISLRLNFSAC